VALVRSRAVEPIAPDRCALTSPRVPCPVSRAGAARHQRTLDAVRGMRTLKGSGRRLLGLGALPPSPSGGEDSLSSSLGSRLPQRPQRSISGPLRVRSTFD
jgi:hypothetical protein